MKTIANRLIVFAAGIAAFGAVAFGQTRMTAEIPFTFHTPGATLPAGTYEFVRITSGGTDRALNIRNVATGKSILSSTPLFDAWKKAPEAPQAVFLCGADGCTLKALRTSFGTYEYARPSQAKNAEQSLALISVPLKAISTD